MLIANQDQEGERRREGRIRNGWMEGGERGQMWAHKDEGEERGKGRNQTIDCVAVSTVRPGATITSLNNVYSSCSSFALASEKTGGSCSSSNSGAASNWGMLRICSRFFDRMTASFEAVLTCGDGVAGVDAARDDCSEE